tara:strand:+ start:263 stop:517 length:255 start_codon:yes stop_codon:yes gene_type:complete
MQIYYKRLTFNILSCLQKKVEIINLLIIFEIYMEFDQYLGFILFLTVLTMGFWLMILLLTFIIPYWVTGSFIERMKEIRDKFKK